MAATKHLVRTATADAGSERMVLSVVQVQHKDKPLVAAQAKTLARLIQGNAANKDMLHRLGQYNQLVSTMAVRGMPQQI